VSKASLREKIAPLPPKLRSLFEPLGLGAIDSGQSKVTDQPNTPEEVNSLQRMSQLRLERLTDAPPAADTGGAHPAVSASTTPQAAKQSPSESPKRALPTGSTPPAAAAPPADTQSSVGGVDVPLDDLED